MSRSTTDRGGRGQDDPPDDLPWYRMITGPDDREFCDRVSEAIGLGWNLYGSPSAASRPDGTLLVAQALVWELPRAAP